MALAGVANLQSTVELRFKCRHLKKGDAFSKSDPMLIMSARDSATRQQFQIVGQTEWIRDNQNPTFQTAIRMPYRFEEEQYLWFEVWDVDKGRLDRTPQNFLGQAKITMANIVSAPGRQVTLNLTLADDRTPACNYKTSTLTISAMELTRETERIPLSLSGVRLDKKDMFGQSDPYFELFRVNDDNSRLSLMRSEVIEENLNPQWKPFEINIATLCGGDYQRPIAVVVRDWNRIQEPKLIGECVFTIDQLLAQSSRRQALELPLIHHDKKTRKGAEYSNSGMLCIQPTGIIRDHTFLDYIAGGCFMRLSMAIDFTGSNGNPAQPTSLHYHNPHRQPHQPGNEYEQAITNIGRIVSPYSSVQSFPTFGFGGSINGAVSHCFPLSLNNNAVALPGVDGILDAYHKAFYQVALAGPTYFTEILQQTEAMVMSVPCTQGQQNYSIFLILTDGVINDYDSTVACLVRMSMLPLSIIIVGVGGADFSAMQRLDGDEAALTDRTGRRAARDIVQFVPFRRFRSIQELAAETLKEIPAQMLSFMKANRIVPMQPRPPVVVIEDDNEPGVHAPLPSANAASAAAAPPDYHHAPAPASLPPANTNHAAPPAYAPPPF